MKVGIRKPNLKKSLKARTTGKLKRQIKKSVNPLYGKKGIGVIKDPKKAIYNKVYNKTTIDARKIVSSSTKKNSYSNSKDIKKQESSSKIVEGKISNVNSIKDKKYVVLKNDIGTIKKCKDGVSWLSFLFFYFVPLFRLDLKNTLIQFIVLTILSVNSTNIIIAFLFIIAYLYFGITYNKTYIKDLMKNGYYVLDDTEYSSSTHIDNFNDNLKTDLSNKYNSDEKLDLVDCNEPSISFTDGDLNKFSYYDEEDYDDEEDNSKAYLSISLSDVINDDNIILDEDAPNGYNNILRYEKVVGVFYENRQDFVEKFIFGKDRKVILQKEPDNIYDANAIKVIGSCNYHGEFITGDMGYLSRQTARQLKDCNSICATINYLNYPDKVVLNIHLDNNEFSIYEKYKLKYEEMKSFDKLSYHENLKGMEYEKDKNIEKAIEHYEKSINYNFSGSHPYNRLAILYRKNKDYDNEIRVLRKAIEIYEVIEKVAQNESQNIKLDKFRERLDKAILLKEKHNNKSKDKKSIN